MIVGLLIALCMLLVLLVLWSTWKLELRLQKARAPQGTPLRTWFFQEQAVDGRAGALGAPQAKGERSRA